MKSIVALLLLSITETIIPSNSKAINDNHFVIKNNEMHTNNETWNKNFLLPPFNLENVSKTNDKDSVNTKDIAFYNSNNSLFTNSSPQKIIDKNTTIYVYLKEKNIAGRGNLYYDYHTNKEYKTYGSTGLAGTPVTTPIITNHSIEEEAEQKEAEVEYEKEQENNELAVVLPNNGGNKNSTNFDLPYEYLKNILRNVSNSNQDICLLNDIKAILMWWCFSNGTLRIENYNISTKQAFLDLSGRNITNDADLLLKVQYRIHRNSKIIAFSAAKNHLHFAPYLTLSSMNHTLKYLTLTGNAFNLYRSQEKNIAWATFPPLPQLSELDLSNCSIEHLTREVFRNLPNLRRLFLGHNNLKTIPSSTFTYVPLIQYLDLSSLNRIYPIPFSIIEPALSSIREMQLPKTIFLRLPNLEYLDLSHTMLTLESHKAFLFANRLKVLSLCRTGFLVAGRAIFKNTPLVILDLSGNPYAPYHMHKNIFDGINDSLQYLLFKKSNIRELNWLQTLSNVRVLALAGNNLNSASLKGFGTLPLLEVLDVSSNHISNWYSRVFQHNHYLRVLNLRDNNINLISTEMLKDFKQLDLLGIAENDFVCDCLLNDLVEIATINTRLANCIRKTLKETHKFGIDIIKRLNITIPRESLIRTIIRSIPTLHRGYYYINAKMLQLNQSHLISTNNFLTVEKSSSSSTISDCFELIPQKPIHEKLNISELKFQLLDHEERNYWCYNETERMQFSQLGCGKSGSYIIEKKNNSWRLIKNVLTVIGSLLGLSLICTFIYLKRWHIHYYYSSLKSATLLSLATKETVDKFNELSKTDPNLIYDIFISYCQNDRPWVLKELLPNVETPGDISICLHERDFEIGVDILDNIISCMDRSKAFMLIISTNFLLSHWCQFEMHLVQHRMFEASKEHLILIFLEDIPRSKRPKILQYLMDVKTYIKWPSTKSDELVKLEDKKLFWRLKKSLENIVLK